MFMVQYRGICEANVARETIFLNMARGGSRPEVSAVIPNALNFCGVFLSTNVKETAVTVCKIHSKVTHMKQQKYFHHLRGRGY